VSKVRKAIIPAAGLGTRFLPATKAMPKEMLPILTKPTIQYIVEEAVASGIEQIIIVSGRSKRAIEDHFDHAPELENILRQKGKLDLLKEVDASTTMAEIHYIRQKEPKGLGHAIWSARHFIGDEPFAVLLGDDIIVSEEPGLKQLMNQYEELDASVVGVRQVPMEDTHRYGIIDPLNQTGRRYQVRQFVEKPVQGTAPSNMEYLATQEAGSGGEIQLTDAIERLNGQEDVYGYELEGKRFDVGEKMGYVETTLAFALEDTEIQADVRNLLRRYVEGWEQE